MPEQLSLIWGRADAPEPVFSGDDACRLGNGKLEALQSAGLVRRIENAQEVTCNACEDGHSEEVILLAVPEPRAYISCPENGRIRVPFDRLLRWDIDFQRLAESCSAAISLAGQIDEVVPSRIWALGTASIGGRSREFFLARGLTWTDAAAIIGSAARLNASSNAVVLVAGAVPPDAVWHGQKPRVLPLSALACIENGKLSIDRDHLVSALAEGRRKATVVATQSFPTPQDTPWPEVRLQVSEHRVRVTARGRTKEFSFQEAGFEDKRTGGVSDSLWTLLRIIAFRGGHLQSEDANLDHEARTNLKQYMTELRKRLHALIPNIDGDPIPYDKGERRYMAAFKISTEVGPRLQAPQGATWTRVAISEARNGMIRVLFRAQETYGVPGRRDEDGVAHGRDAAEREVEQEREFDLISLKLADAKGKPDPQGEALLAVLRGRGVVRRPMDDDAMLKLGGFLCDWTSINDSAFDFAPNDEKWIAKFEASSETVPAARRR